MERLPPGPNTARETRGWAPLPWGHLVPLALDSAHWVGYPIPDGAQGSSQGGWIWNLY